MHMYMLIVGLYRFKKPPSPLSLYREASFGHGRLRIVNETHAHWSWHRNNDSEAFVAEDIWMKSLSNTKECWESLGQQISHEEL